MVWRVWRFILEIWEARLFDKMAYYAEKAYKQIAMEANTKKWAPSGTQLKSSALHTATFHIYDDGWSRYRFDGNLATSASWQMSTREEKRRGRVRNVKNHALPPANRRRLSDSSSSSEKSGEEKNIHEIPKIHKFSAPDMWENICTVTMIWEERWRKGKEKKKKIHRNDTATRPKQHYKIQYLTEFLALDFALVGFVQQRCDGDVRGGLVSFSVRLFRDMWWVWEREAQTLNPFNKSSTHPYESRCQPVSRCVYLRWRQETYVMNLYSQLSPNAYLHFFCVFMTVSPRWLWHRLIDRSMCVEHGVPGQSQFSASWVTQIHFNFVHVSHC